MGAGDRAVRIGSWLLPVYGVLLGLSTLTRQPPVQDFTAYARYVTTGSFLLSHLIASILGAAVGVLGVVAITAVLVRGRRARPAVIGLGLTTVANVLLTAVFGSAAFVQPAIGRAHLAGVPGMPEFNADSAYGPVLLSTAVLAEALFGAAAVVTGVAVAGTDRRLRWPGAAYAVLLPMFALAGFAGGPLQPLAGFSFAAAAVVLAVRLTAVTARVPHGANRCAG